tara:strand:+ start:50 stop:553 length:504 start_codon:yes stop_codon:yes gene_type:complete
MLDLIKEVSMPIVKLFKKLVKRVRPKKASGKKTKKKKLKKTKGKAVKKPSKKPKAKVSKKTTKRARLTRAKKKTAKSSPKGAKKAKEKEIGRVTHYFGKIKVGIIKLKSSLKVNERIHIKGAHDDFKQIIKSMQCNHEDISTAKKGLEIGIKVTQPVHENDRVYKIG